MSNGEIKRYDLDWNYGDPIIDEDMNGDYVKHSDYAAQASAIVALKEQLASARDVGKSAKLAEALRWALEWIDAVPEDATLPAMPGFDRDYVNDLLATPLPAEQPSNPVPRMGGNTETWPERIYLQAQNEWDDSTDTYQPQHEITWCVDQISQHDVEYVRADLARIVGQQTKGGGNG